MSRLLRWGIIGTGVIARAFAKDLREHTSDINELVSVLTRNVEQAGPFLKQNGLPNSRAYTEFAAFASSGVDVCYIASPHTTHVDLALKCLRNGLHVLSEKPFALNTQNINRVFDLAISKNLFFMEALWTRFIPAMQRAREAVQSGAIGDVVSITVDHGFDGSHSPARLMDPRLAGGALYDLGTYSLQLGTLLSSPSENCSPAILHTDSERRQNGVDEEFRAVLSYPTRTGDLILNARLSVVEDTSCTGFIQGKKGYIVIEAPFHSPNSFVLNGERIEIKREGHGLHYQTREVHRCILSGRRESPRVPWRASLNFAETFARLAAHDLQSQQTASAAICDFE